MPNDEVGWKVVSRLALASSFVTWKPAGSEDLQVLNYGLGGQYRFHLDAHGYWEGKTSNEMFKMLGDRIATMLLYLSDVEEGGATAFPATGVKVMAKKGTAAFFFDLKTSGLVDTLTYHGGCPVLVGSKWISNLWIGYSDQFLTFPCDIKGYNERYKYFTKHY